MEPSPVYLSLFKVRPLEVSVEAVSPTLEAGETGWLSCRAVGSRPRSRITWLLGDQALTGARQNESLDGNVTLSWLALRPTARHHGQLLRCRADNDLIPGSDIFAEFRLQVLLYGAASNQPVRVNCEVESEPAPSAFHWRLDNETLTNFSSSGHSSHVTLVPRRFPQDLAQRLLCWASNEIGTQREPCVFGLVPARDPEPPRNCSLQNRTASAFAVECEPGDDGGMPPVYVLQGPGVFQNRSPRRAEPSFFCRFISQRCTKRGTVPNKLKYGRLIRLLPQIAPLHQYPDGVLKLRSPQSEEKCPDVVLDVNGSEERLKEDDRPSEAVRWKGWNEADPESEVCPTCFSPFFFEDLFTVFSRNGYGTFELPKGKVYT
ncbi:hypothetical protein HPB48_007812 [Haemaphysalis longicornis]|uniref:Ig-like domain-containing protein n=1 Tax=Haemaphysalis longicornis TaxID=44386 RepID=A0A9J6G0K4_HAELO|nr:hypothetical protein HPB48_007812 [Haemaphysalis longicornis]